MKKLKGLLLNMPGGDAAVADPELGIPAREDTESSPPLDETWREVLLEIDENELETDLEKRNSLTPFNKALELATSYPDSITISTRPVERGRNMSEHIREDIRTLLGSEHFEHRFISPVPRTDTLLKVFELGYIYDAAFRFCTEIIFQPGEDGLEEIRFSGIPAELIDWMSRVDILWRIVNGDIPRPEDTTVEELTDEIYEKRLSFITEAREMDMFVPVPATDAERHNPDKLAEKIDTHLTRNRTVNFDLIYRYCYNRVLEY